MLVASLIPNTPDRNHCVQASFRMAMEALAGRDPGPARAEELTGWVPGRGTWQFRMLIALADAGLAVADVEPLDVERFLADPAAEIVREVESREVAEQYIADTDLEAEVAALRACVAHPRIAFVDRAPTIGEARDALEGCALLLCHVNGKALTDEPGHSGHMVVVERIDEHSVLLHNPGPPARFRHELPIATFERAWREMRNFIRVAPGDDPLAWLAR